MVLRYVQINTTHFSKLLGTLVYQPFPNGCLLFVDNIAWSFKGPKFEADRVSNKVGKVLLQGRITNKIVAILTGAILLASIISSPCIYYLVYICIQCKRIFTHPIRGKFDQSIMQMQWDIKWQKVLGIKLNTSTEISTPDGHFVFGLFHCWFFFCFVNTFI